MKIVVSILLLFGCHFVVAKECSVELGFTLSGYIILTDGVGGDIYPTPDEALFYIQKLRNNNVCTSIKEVKCELYISGKRSLIRAFYFKKYSSGNSLKHYYYLGGPFEDLDYANYILKRYKNIGICQK
ncbi:MAG: hypothetical protein ACK5V3_00135 [Bdellovibrionales bacterium]